MPLVQAEVQIKIPGKIHKALGIKEGDHLEAEVRVR